MNWRDTDNEKPDEGRPFLARTLIYSNGEETHGYAALVLNSDGSGTVDLFYADADRDEEYGWSWEDGPVASWVYIDEIETGKWEAA